MLRVLVTGGLGFIGSHVCDYLSTQGHFVFAYDNLLTGRMENVRPTNMFVIPAIGDIRDTMKLKEMMHGCDAIVHCAALVTVAGSEGADKEFWDVNVLGTRSVMQAAVEAGVHKIIAFSSAAVYGDTMGTPSVEGDPLAPLSVYGITKMEMENALSEFPGEVTILRPFNVYGPRQRGDSPYAGVIAKLMHCARTGEDFTMYGDGSATRDFVHVADVAKAVDLLLEPGSEGAFNVCTGVSTSVSYMMHRLRTIALAAGGKEFRMVLAEPREGEVQFSAGSAWKLIESGWLPTISIDDGLVYLCQETLFEQGQKGGATGFYRRGRSAYEQ